MINLPSTTGQVDKKVPLSDPQREAVEHIGGPLLIAAGAGSGKTRTLTQRLIWMIKNGIEPSKILAITFTNKAADEMKKRIYRDLGERTPGQMPYVGTFHSFCARILRKEARHLGRTPSYVIFDSDDSKKVTRKVLKIIDHKETQTPAKTGREISRIKSNLLDTDDLEEPIKTIYETYEDELKRQNAFDFDDLIEKVVYLLGKNPAVLNKYQAKYSHVLVDEYQDINTSQYELIRLLCQKHKNITVASGQSFSKLRKFVKSDQRNP